MLRVAFVCTGNRARSPLAAALLARRAGSFPVRVYSYGTLDVDGMPVLPTAHSVAASLGLDLSGHRARALRRGGLAHMDLVVGFERQHETAAVEVGAAPLDRAFLLLELPKLLDAVPPSRLPPLEHAHYAIGELQRLRTAAGSRRIADLPDPLGQPEQVVAETARVIDAVTAGLAKALFPAAAAGSAGITEPGPEG